MSSKDKVLKTIVFAAVSVACSTSLAAKPLAAENKKDGPPRKTQVCSITINSTDEIEAFKAALGTKDFDYVELTKMRAAGSQSESAGEIDEDWFKHSCASQIRCDILVISGHFGGNFFSETNRSLHLEMSEVEKVSCDSRCDGILQAPKEVYLFGCNTLAGKKPDSRTPEQYRQVLLQHNPNLTPAQAEQIVAFRYSPIGHTNGERMTRVFRGAQRIYGFDSKAPLGRQVKPLLSKYLKAAAASGYYTPKRLDALTTAKNEAFAQALSGQAVTQAQGNKSIQREQIPVCYLEDPKVAFARKLSWIEKMLSSESSLEYLPAINEFLERKKNHKWTDKEWESFERLSSNRDLRARLEGIVQQRDQGILGEQLKIMTFLRFIGWMLPAEYTTRIEKLLFGPLDKDFTLEQKDQICSFARSADFKTSIDYDRIPEARWKDPEFLRALECASHISPKVFWRAVDEYKSGPTKGELSKSLKWLIQAYAQKASPEERKIFWEKMLGKSRVPDAHVEELFYFTDLITVKGLLMDMDEIPAEILAHPDRFSKIRYYVRPSERVLEQTVEMLLSDKKEFSTEAGYALERWSGEFAPELGERLGREMFRYFLTVPDYEKKMKIQTVIRKAKKLDPSVQEEILGALEKGLASSSIKYPDEWYGMFVADQERLNRFCGWVSQAVPRLLAADKSFEALYTMSYASSSCQERLLETKLYRQVLEVFGNTPRGSEVWRKVASWSGWVQRDPFLLQALARGVVLRSTGEALAFVKILELAASPGYGRNKSIDIDGFMADSGQVTADLQMMLKSSDEAEREDAVLALMAFKADRRTITNLLLKESEQRSVEPWTKQWTVFRALAKQDSKAAEEAFFKLLPHVPVRLDTLHRHRLYGLPALWQGSMTGSMVKRVVMGPESSVEQKVAYLIWAKDNLLSASTYSALLKETMQENKDAALAAELQQLRRQLEEEERRRRDDD